MDLIEAQDLSPEVKVITHEDPGEHICTAGPRRSPWRTVNLENIGERTYTLKPGEILTLKKFMQIECEMIDAFLSALPEETSCDLSDDPADYDLAMRFDGRRITFWLNG